MRNTFIDAGFWCEIILAVYFTPVVSMAITCTTRMCVRLNEFMNKWMNEWITFDWIVCSFTIRWTPFGTIGINDWTIKIYGNISLWIFIKIDSLMCIQNIIVWIFWMQATPLFLEYTIEIQKCNNLFYIFINL